MQVKAQLTKQDYSKLRRFAIVRIRKVWLIYLPMAALFAWVAFPSNYAAHGMSFAVALTMTSLIALILSAIIFFLSLGLTALLPNRPGTVLGEHTFTITDSEFQESNGAGSASTKLDVLRRYETAEHIFLLTPTHTSYILPLRDVRANPEFMQALRERTRNA